MKNIAAQENRRRLVIGHETSILLENATKFSLRLESFLIYERREHFAQRCDNKRHFTIWKHFYFFAS